MNQEQPPLSAHEALEEEQDRRKRKGLSCQPGSSASQPTGIDTSRDPQAFHRLHSNTLTFRLIHSSEREGGEADHIGLEWNHGRRNLPALHPKRLHPLQVSSPLTRDLTTYVEKHSSYLPTI